MTNEKEVSLILTAVKFAADKHRRQRRKGAEGSPYINHPIDVAETLWRLGGVRDTSVIIAAILHDTVEDTLTTPDEIERLFGEKIRSLVEEVSDDKSLEKKERKRLQVEHAPHLSNDAKQIKLADKVFNVSEVTFSPPDWPHERRIEYLDWAEEVVTGLRGCNIKLENGFDTVLRVARAALRSSETATNAVMKQNTKSSHNEPTGTPSQGFRRSTEEQEKRDESNREFAQAFVEGLNRGAIKSHEQKKKEDQ